MLLRPPHDQLPPVLYSLRRTHPRFIPFPLIRLRTLLASSDAFIISPFPNPRPSPNTLRFASNSSLTRTFFRQNLPSGAPPRLSRVPLHLPMQSARRTLQPLSTHVRAPIASCKHRFRTPSAISARLSSSSSLMTLPRGQVCQATSSLSITASRSVRRVK